MVLHGAPSRLQYPAVQSRAVVVRRPPADAVFPAPRAVDTVPSLAVFSVRLSAAVEPALPGPRVTETQYSQSQIWTMLGLISGQVGLDHKVFQTVWFGSYPVSTRKTSLEVALTTSAERLPLPYIVKLEAGLLRPSVDVDALTTFMACCDLDLQNVTRSSIRASEYSLSALSNCSRCS